MSSGTATVAVYDCTTFAQALINPKGPAGACVRAAQQNELRLFVSDYVLQEIRELPDKLPSRLGVTRQRVENFVRDLAKYAQVIGSVPKVFSYARDEDDSPYIDLAHAAGADYLVTRDKDLLDLMNAITPDGQDFARRFPDLKIVNPVAFLQEMTRKIRDEAK